MKKMIYVILIFAVLGLAVTVLKKNGASQDTLLAKEIGSLLENGETQIDLSELTDFDWTQVATFGPYTTNEVIEESMEIKFKGNNGGIDILEDRFLLVFADEKYALKTVILSRKYGNYDIKDNKFLIVEQ
ncbi:MULTISPECIES: hypothetical protein [unclassified Solibacillus]|uniref:hypothetical protein n=1 Tax=unclassified Solibacillus TaxID=2637870 RepID=UPI0030F9F6D9